MFSYVSCCHCCCCSEAACCVNVDKLPYCNTILTHTDSWPELATMYHTTKQKLMLMFKQQAEFPLVSPVFFRWVQVRCCPVHKSQLLSRSENRGRSGFSVLIKKMSSFNTIALKKITSHDNICNLPAIKLLFWSINSFLWMYICLSTIS